MYAFAFISARQWWQQHPRFGALCGAPMLLCALAVVGDVFCMSALQMWLATRASSYVKLIENKEAVASVVRAKFGKGLAFE